MKVISNLNAIAIAVVLLLITGTGVTNFITPAYAPEPAGSSAGSMFLSGTLLLNIA